MIYEIIAALLLLDSTLALLISFTKLGDNSIEQMVYIKRHLPLTRGWTIVYFMLSAYIAYLTFIIL